MSENYFILKTKVEETDTSHNTGIIFVDETMFNSKSTIDYMNEMDRLFPKPETTKPLTMAQNYTSPLQTDATNKSSSPDSISPDSYFDYTIYNRQSEYRTRCETPKPTYYGSQHFGSSTNIYDPKSNFESPKSIYNSICNSPKSIDGSPNLNMSPRNIFEHRDIYELPTFGTFHGHDATNYVNYDSIDPRNTQNLFPVRRQRPIMGRKILGSSQSTQENETSWQFEGLPLTPPERNKTYELFPYGNREYELNAVRNPIKPPHFDALSNSSNLTYSLSYTPNYPRLPMHSQNSVSAVSSFSSINDIGSSTICTFCRKNGETPVVYLTHCVKKKIGNRHVVTCPILRSHVCQTCGASGDNAHTITYCPVLRSSNNGQPLQSTTITLKNTRVKSNGKRRF